MQAQPNERTDIVEDTPTDLEPLTLDLATVTQLETAVDLYLDRYLPLCIKMTQPSDWVSHSKGKYSLQCSGAEKICNPLGIEWDEPVIMRLDLEDERGKYYEFECKGKIYSKALRRGAFFTGNCDSRDPFFVARGRFDMGDIRKSAFSNWLVNAVTRLAGIRNPTPELFKRAGLDPSKIPGIDYGGNTSEQKGGEFISDAQGKRLYAMSKTAKMSTETLKEYLKDEYKTEHSKEIKKKDYEAICKWVEEWKAEEE